MTTRSHQYLNEDGFADGGHAYGRGFAIAWQRGPLLSEGPNGAYIEDVIEAVRARLLFHQSTRCACDENAQALGHLDRALEHLAGRQERVKAEAAERAELGG